MRTIIFKAFDNGGEKWSRFVDHKGYGVFLHHDGSIVIFHAETQYKTNADTPVGKCFNYYSSMSGSTYSSTLCVDDGWSFKGHPEYIDPPTGLVYFNKMWLKPGKVYTPQMLAGIRETPINLRYLNIEGVEENGSIVCREIKLVADIDMSDKKFSVEGYTDDNLPRHLWRLCRHTNGSKIKHQTPLHPITTSFGGIYNLSGGQYAFYSGKDGYVRTFRNLVSSLVYLHYGITNLGTEIWKDEAVEFKTFDGRHIVMVARDIQGVAYEYEVEIIDDMTVEEAAKLAFEGLNRKVKLDQEDVTKVYRSVTATLDLMQKHPEAILTFQDSIDVGNCEFGTTQFQEEFGLPNSMSFKDILEHKDFDSIIKHSLFRKAVVAKVLK